MHHVMARGIDGTDVFRDRRDYESFLERLGELVTEAKARLYAWCLMPNHFHLFLRPEAAPLAWIMRRLTTGHAVRHNLRHRRTGHLFQNRYKSIVVEEEPYLLELVRYIHLNPVRAGLVQDMDDLDRFPYAGHSVLVGGRDCAWQDVEGVLGWFAKDRDKGVRLYRYFMAAGFEQGSRAELTGGGLVRSAGGVEAVQRRKKEAREAADERVLGSGAFVEEVWQAGGAGSPGQDRSMEAILDEVSAKWGMPAERILGASRERQVARVRREFLLRACEETGTSMAELARLCSRSHVAVRQAIDKARRERQSS
jgi:REP element-mobilizing transposase RayT